MGLGSVLVDWTAVRQPEARPRPTSVLADNAGKDFEKYLEAEDTAVTASLH